MAFHEQPEVPRANTSMNRVLGPNGSIGGNLRLLLEFSCHASSPETVAFEPSTLTPILPASEVSSVCV